MIETTPLTRFVLVAEPRSTRGPSVRRLRLARLRVDQPLEAPAAAGTLERLRRVHD